MIMNIKTAKNKRFLKAIDTDDRHVLINMDHVVNMYEDNNGCTVIYLDDNSSVDVKMKISKIAEVVEL